MMAKIPFPFLARVKIPVTWDDIAFAYETGLVDGRSVISFACDELSKCDSHCQAVFELACSQPSDSLAGSLSRLTRAGSDSNASRKKWAIILAAYIAERDDLDQLTKLEDIYSSFDYPIELSAFVRYMPMVGSDLGSVLENERRMIASLKEFAKTIVEPSTAAISDVSGRKQ